MSIKIIINTPKTTSDPITINVNLDTTVKDAKEKYYTLVNSRENNQWLYGGAVLKDTENFSSIGIDNLDIIEAHPIRFGGEISYSINS